MFIVRRSFYILFMLMFDAYNSTRICVINNSVKSILSQHVAYCFSILKPFIAGNINTKRQRHKFVRVLGFLGECVLTGISEFLGHTHCSSSPQWLSHVNTWSNRILGAIRAVTRPDTEPRDCHARKLHQLFTQSLSNHINTIRQLWPLL